MWDILRIFLLMGLCWVLLTPVNTLALSMQRLRAFVVAAVVAVVAQVVVVVPLGRAVGPEAVAIAHAVLAVAMILLVAAGVFGRDAPRACLSAFVAGLPAIALAVVFPLLGRGGAGRLGGVHRLLGGGHRRLPRAGGAPLAVGRAPGARERAAAVLASLRATACCGP